MNTEVENLEIELERELEAKGFADAIICFTDLRTVAVTINLNTKYFYYDIWLVDKVISAFRL